MVVLREVVAVAKRGREAPVQAESQHRGFQKASLGTAIAVALGILLDLLQERAQ